MFFVFDSVLTPLIVIGVFVYFALKGLGESLNNVKDAPANKMSNGEDFKDWFMRLCEKNRKRDAERLDEMRYEKWLYDHRPKE